MKRRFDTLFVRLAVTSLVVVLLVQIGGMAIIVLQRPKHDLEGYARGLQIAIEVAHLHEQAGTINGLDFGADHGAPPPGMDGMNRPSDINPMHHPRHVRYVDVNASEAHELSSASHMTMPHVLQLLMTRLPTGTDIRLDRTQPSSLWIRYPASARWIVMPFDEPPTPPFLIELSAMAIASIVLALIAAWQLQLPVSRVALAARAFGRSRRLPPVKPSGPRELRELATSFNDMMQRVEDAENSQAVMLAGVAHDLKSPLMRLRLRADLLEDISERQGFLRDVESLTHIVEQFLRFANETPDASPLINVDEAIRTQYGGAGSADDPDELTLFELSLQAGDAFMQSRTLIDRLVGNLVDNALDHGDPPVVIATRREADHWIIEVRDHGLGIPHDKINDVVLPFVRLDSSRGGEGHCGLGLAIVHRLTQQEHGECTIDNASDGGLVVTIRLPASPRQTPSPR